MNVKKSFTIFIIFSFLWFAMSAIMAVSGLNWLCTAVCAVAAWSVFFAYFCRISYVVEGGVLKISSGILFRRERIVPLEIVHIRTKISVRGHCLLTILAFSGGNVAVFADVP